MKEISVTEGIRLEALEAKAQRALDTAESSWREFAEAMRDIKDSEAHKEAGYRYFQPYYRDVWEERAGRTWKATTNVLYRLRAVEEFEAALGDSGPSQLPATDTAQILKAALPDPLERVEAWNLHLESGRGIGHNREGVQETIREYKGEPTVRDVLKPEDMADLPSGEFDQFENWASETSKLVGPLHRMQPDEVADACERLYPEKIERHIAWAEEIAQWYAAYRDELVARQRQGIHAVK